MTRRQSTAEARVAELERRYKAAPKGRRALAWARLYEARQAALRAAKGRQ